MQSYKTCALSPYSNGITCTAPPELAPVEACLKGSVLVTAMCHLQSISQTSTRYKEENLNGGESNSKQDCLCTANIS